MSVSDRPNYVVFSGVGPEASFDWSDDRTAARDSYEHHVRTAWPGRDIPTLRKQYGRLAVLGGGIEPSGELTVGLFHAHRLETDQTPSSFALARFGLRVMPLLGPQSAVDALLGTLRETVPASSAALYRPRQPVDPMSARSVPSEMRETPSARVVLEDLIANRQPAGGAWSQLSAGELIWLGHQARTRERPSLALDAAAAAWGRKASCGALNLRAAALRDIAAFDESEEVYRQSLALCSSAEFNPYAYVGLAATLRRQGDPDELAYDLAKQVHRYYPSDKYANEVMAAVLRDERGTRSAAAPVV